MFHGSMVALVTPMTALGEVDFSALTTLVDFHLSNQTDAIVVAGTTGESATLTIEEQHKMISHVREQVRGRIPVIAGTGVSSTQKTLDLTLAAMQLGVDACLIMAPAYIKPTQEGLYLHYKTIAENAAIPIILYNVPGRTVSDILPETVARLAQLPNIVGIKEASGQLERTQKILALCGSSIDIYSGDDIMTHDIMLAGGKGVISVTANVAPRLVHDMCDAILQKDFSKASALNSRLTELNKALFVEANPIPLKWALHRMGLIPSGIRLPLTTLSSQFHGQVENALMNAGVLSL